METGGHSAKQIIHIIAQNFADSMKRTQPIKTMTDQSTEKECQISFLQVSGEFREASNARKFHTF